jgi:hypothetical protein
LILPVVTIVAPAAADVEQVKNTEPAHPPRTVQLEELWRVGGEDGELLFGAIVGTTTDPDGNVYLLDHHLKHVEVISPDGEHLRTLSGEGDGPGEIRNPPSYGVAALDPSGLRPSPGSALHHRCVAPSSRRPPRAS